MPDQVFFLLLLFLSSSWRLGFHLKITGGEQTELGIWAKAISNKDPHTHVDPKEECFRITKNQTWKTVIILWDLLGRFQELRGEKKEEKNNTRFLGQHDFFFFWGKWQIFFSNGIILCFPMQHVYTVQCLL